jgi:ubiquinone/menaquinone biosynthesis C-methylase UbiE
MKDSIPEPYRAPEFVETVNRLYHDLEAEIYEASHPEILVGERRRWKVLLGMTGLDKRPEPRVLDIGTGPGFVVKQVLSRRPAARVLAVDISDAMLQRARESVAEEFPGASVDYRNAPIDALELLDRSFDCVTMNSVLHHLPRPDRLMANVARWLAPGGFLVLAHEPNHRFYANAQCLEWTGRAVRWSYLWSIYAAPSRYIKKAARMLRLIPPRQVRPTLAARVIERLRDEKAVGPETPFDPLWLDALVDVHIPRQDGLQGGRCGLVLDDLLSKTPGLTRTHYEDYDYLADKSRAGPLFRLVNRVLSKRHPGCGAHFAAVIRKDAD